MARLTAAAARKFGLTAAKKDRLDRKAKVYPPSAFDLRALQNGGWMLWLPWPPSNNKYWRRYGNATTIGLDARAYRKAVESFLAGKDVKFGDKRLRVEIRLLAPTRRKFDLDNYAKCILDSLAHAGVFSDDSQIDVLTLERGMVVQGGGAAVVSIRTVLLLAEGGAA